MIKFFRKIRQDLLSKGKTKQYIKYAIGEIVLVVIGILIALSINNWNEKRQQKQYLNDIYTIIAEDLKNGVTNVNQILSLKKQKEPIFKKVLDDKMTKQDYDKCKDCKYLILGSPDLSIETRGYNLLNNFGSSKINEDSLTIKIVQFYTKQLDKLNVDNVIRGNDIENNVNNWKDNYHWYSGYITQGDSDGFVDYALNNQDYINRVANYYLLNYTIYIPILEDFNAEAQVIIEQLEEIIEK